MIVIQEMMMCKWKAIFRMFWDTKYRKNIYHLRDILSKAPLTGEKSTLKLEEINFSHDINYPDWCDKLIFKLACNQSDYKRIKVFYDDNRWIVIDGNHRLFALKYMLPPDTEIDVLKLTYSTK